MNSETPSCLHPRAVHVASEQTGEFLWCELCAALARAEAAEKLRTQYFDERNSAHAGFNRMRDELCKVEAERDEALAELDRLTTLRPASEYDEQNEALWWYGADDFHGASYCIAAPYWTPIPHPHTERADMSDELTERLRNLPLRSKNVCEHGHLARSCPLCEAAEELTRLRAEVEELKTVLSPFAALLQEHHSRMSDEHPLFGINSAIFTVGHLRAAQAALAQEPKNVP